jgi:hypothetical protein
MLLLEIAIGILILYYVVNLIIGLTLLVLGTQANNENVKNYGAFHLICLIPLIGQILFIGAFASVVYQYIIMYVRLDNTWIKKLAHNYCNFLHKLGM